MAMTSSTTSGKKSLFFQDTRNNQEYDAKSRLSITVNSSEKLLAEIIPLKENRPNENCILVHENEFILVIRRLTDLW